ncbi:mitogen-activated protein kinase kinase kinase 4 isoform X2 [Anthonomus grandis grandis]|uniref:mitogen-activated protein kinase kinase kinase 4 isoform X2 n=1 Tax=Anthonomus grandis grandis TaxID=2921223 RepID=UPI0021653C89|nr:mitogen-activated protein kinase kinase kinase 4 isoform X2 [Anthonomus grandis grandis]
MDEELGPNDDSAWDIYGKTPPRTKILRKNRERRQKYAGGSESVNSNNKAHKVKNQLVRRNTVSTMYDELIANAEKSDSEQPGATKQRNKRHLKLLRGSERDLKLDIVTAQAVHSKKFGPYDWEPRTPSYSIECGKRFMCLSGRMQPCQREHPATIESEEVGGGKKTAVEDNSAECPQSRVEFYQTLSLLIRMGGTKEERSTRRGMSREESLWQTEFKDLIWLELQAYHADRTPIEEDDHLCTQRESVEPLLDDIMNYRFERRCKTYGTQNSDSGVEEVVDCPGGCNSVFCSSCVEAQNDALREVEGLMRRLEEAEALFPSSKAFSELFPLYCSPEFVSRVKAIVLWFNMTETQRLTVNSLARLVLCLEAKPGSWPVMSDEANGSSTDSNNSVTSSVGEISVCSMIKNDIYNIVPLALLITKKDQNNVSPYRRYIENILKTRALYKSLSFLESMHVNVLDKVNLTLAKPEDAEIFSQVVCRTQEEELVRYGAWSPEADQLRLPSYRAIFLFLAAVPSEVINEYLRMRLEQKPQNPSPLSVRQLMRELKEGLRVAVTERDRVDRYLKTFGHEHRLPPAHTKTLDDFSNCLLAVFRDYLGYLEQWVLLHHDTFQKNLLEEEFRFSLGVIKHIEGGGELLSDKYVAILSRILERIADRLMKKVDGFLVTIGEEGRGTLKQTLFNVCRELQSIFNDEREMSMKTMAFAKLLTAKCRPSNTDGFKSLKNCIVAFKCIIPTAIAKVQSFFNYVRADYFDESDRHALCSRIREILMQIYRFGFEFYKEMADGVPTDYRAKLIYSMVQFAKLWMSFVTERCERGRGMRPRWANQGMEFLLTVCDPAHTKYLTDEEFEDLKRSMDECISHLIGKSAPSTPDSGFYSASSPRVSLEHIRTKSRGPSPSPRPPYKSQRSAAPPAARKTSGADQQSPGCTDLMVDGVALTYHVGRRDDRNGIKIKAAAPPKSHGERVLDAVETLERKIDEKLRRDQLIGTIVRRSDDLRSHIKRRNVAFSWQRGIKIGQGRFGKVYTAVNNNTGEMMAVKEIPLQHNDSATIKRVSSEMKILEGITHDNLVKYYGLEVYTDKMLLFMEFCAEGTLENLIRSTERGLPEPLLRKYTYQLLSGVACLHDHGIVHRDIKPANVFLTDQADRLKIGDFGCAAKIKSNVTMPGELQGFVGTQAYMAPEVFTKNMNEGHGRAADIWSVGCVVIEMASAKRPWAQYDSNYQIMFKVGMGQSPEPPDDLIEEGLDFLRLCFKHDPRERASAHQLLDHNFVKVGNDLI